MAKVASSYGMTVFEVSERSRWSGVGDVPAIGTRVRITFNNLGHGTVEGYFVEDAWLGIYVRLEAPPEWWLLRHGKGVSVSQFGRIPGCAMVFGIEIDSLEVKS